MRVVDKEEKAAQRTPEICQRSPLSIQKSTDQCTSLRKIPETRNGACSHQLDWENS